MRNANDEKELGKLYDARIARRLLGYARPYKRKIVAALVLTIVISLLLQVGPMLTRWAIDGFIKPAFDGKLDQASAFKGISLIVTAYLLVLVVNPTLSYFQELILNTIGQNAMLAVREQIFIKLQTIDISYYDRTPVGRLMTRLTSDVDALNDLFTSGLIATLGDVVLIAGALGVMFYYNWRLTLVSMALIPLLAAATAWFRRGTRVSYRKVRLKVARLNAFMQEYLAGMHVVQLFNREEKALAQMAEINREHLDANLDTVFYYGAGKTTITNLLFRFYDVQRGAILVDGVDVRDWQLPRLRENFSVVSQDIFLFSGDVASNIRLGNRTIPEERVMWAAREVGAAQFIERLPERYASKVKERGAGLSVGQKQLISFARALAFNPHILILDEATSSIDSHTEQTLQRAMDRVMDGRTSIIIAHRLSTIESVDKIVVLHKGAVWETGHHQQLMQKCGLYYTLYQLQYKDQAHPGEVEYVQLAEGVGSS